MTAQQTVDAPLIDVIRRAIVGPGERLARLRRAADAINSHHIELRSLLHRVVSAPKVTDQIRQTSYWHPNGFAKVMLHIDEDHDFQIRLHVWPTGKRRLACSNPHSHRCDYASALVVGGGLQIVRFTEMPDVTDAAQGKDEWSVYDRHSQESKSDSKSSAFRHDGVVRLKASQAVLWKAGAAYTCGTDVVHTVEPINAALMATILVQDTMRESSTVVYRRHSGSVANQSRVTLRDEELPQLLTAVIAAMSNSKQTAGVVSLTPRPQTLRTPPAAGLPASNSLGQV
jgi:hypothetical protein